MSDLKHRQQKIQEARKKTPWREFLMHIASWYPFNFYKNQGVISKYHPGNGRIGKIVESKQYEEQRNDLYDASSYVEKVGKEGFRQILNQLMQDSPHESLKIFQNCENSNYTDIAFGTKNAYLSSCVLSSENVFYSVQVKGNSSNIFNSLLVYDHGENVLSSKSVVKSFNIFYSAFIQNCGDIRFSSNLIGCHECILCDNLINQSYVIENKQYVREVYEERKKQILAQKQLFPSYHKKSFSYSGMNTGEHIQGSGNLMSEQVENGFLNYAIKNGRNVCFSGDGTLMEDVYDAFSTGCLACNNYYGVMGVGYNATHIYCCIETAVNAHNCYYCYYLESCSFCVGCVGLKNKSYCIFNKQYTKEERYQKVDELFTQMAKEGILGNFFPGQMNPFYFNDTAAYLIEPTFMREEVTAMGYLWRDEPIHVDIPTGAEVVSVDDLSQYEGVSSGGIRTIDPEIMKKIIKDKDGNIYRIVPKEYEFLMKYQLPLPKQHRLERMKMNFKISSLTA